VVVSLSKGGQVSLTEDAPNLTRVMVGLGWDARATTGYAHDLDASALICDHNGMVLSDRHFVYYNNLTSPCGSVQHTGDETCGGTPRRPAANWPEGGPEDDEEQDEEVITVNLMLVPRRAERIVFPVSIYEADEREQNFGQISNAYIRIINQDDGRELARYNLTEDASAETAMVFAELYRQDHDWRFRAIGRGYRSGLRGIAQDFGVDV
jgi:tellurium resistance protein TerD